MTQKQLDDAIMKCKANLLPKSEDEIYERVLRYCDDNGKLDLSKAIGFAYIESVKYANDIVYTLLQELLVED